MASMAVTDLPLLDHPPMPSRAEMVRAFFDGDASYDGLFYTGVRTTGIFCRPSCTARKPKPESGEFCGTVKDGVCAGYRACLRCKPLDSGGQHPAWLDALMARIDAEPAARIREADLRAMGLDPARVRRYCASRYGLTFQAYCRARRLSH